MVLVLELVKVVLFVHGPDTSTVKYLILASSSMVASLYQHIALAICVALSGPCPYRI